MKEEIHFYSSTEKFKFLKKSTFFKSVWLIILFLGMEGNFYAQCGFITGEGCSNNDYNNAFMNSTTNAATIEYDNYVAGYHTTAVRTSTGVFQVWGDRAANNGTSPVLTPQEITKENYPALGTAKVLKVAMATYSTHHTQMVALTTEGLFAWGTEGLLIDENLTTGTTFQKLTFGSSSNGLPPGVSPSSVKMITGTTSGVGVGNYTGTLALVTCAGELWMLSEDANLRGIGNSGNSTTWYKVTTSSPSNPFLDNVIAVRVTSLSAMALTSDGSLYSWGFGSYLGDGNSAATRSRATLMSKPAGTPKMIAITPFTDPVNINIGNPAFYVLMDTGDLWSLGNNNRRQLGDFTTTERRSWVQPRYNSASGQVMNNIKWISTNTVDQFYPAVNVLTNDYVQYSFGCNSMGMIGRGGSAPNNANDSAFNPGIPLGLSPTTKVTSVITGGHVSMNTVECETNFGYVGHRINGSMGNGESNEANEGSYQFDTAYIPICSSNVPFLSINSEELCVGETYTLSGNPTGGTFTLVSGPATLSGNQITFTGYTDVTINYAYTNTQCNSTLIISRVLKATCFNSCAISATNPDSDGDGISDACDLDSDNDGILDINENCNPYLAQNTSGAWKGKTASNLTVNLPNAGTQSFLSLFSDGKNQYAINQNGGTERILGSGNINYTYTFSNPVPANEIAFWMLDVDPQLSTLPVSYQIKINDGDVNGSLIAVNYNTSAPYLWFDNEVGILTVPNATTADYTIMLKGIGTTPISKITITSSNLYSGDAVAYSLFALNPCDTDGDGIPDYLDLDSDNDGCPDALEGGAEIAKIQLVIAGGTLSGGTSPVNQNLCADGSCVSTSGSNIGLPQFSTVPVGYSNTTGQTIGGSIDANVNQCVSVCDGEKTYILMQNVSGMSGVSSLYTIDMITGESELVKSPILPASEGANRRINSMGYNPADGFLYGYRSSTNQIVKMDALGNYTLITVPDLVVSDVYESTAGDIYDNNLYLFVNNQRKLWKIDLSTFAVTEITFSLSNNSDITKFQINDFVISKDDGNVYGVLTWNSNLSVRLFRINLTTNVLSYLGNATGADLLTESGTWGTAFLDSARNLYAGNNASRNTYKFEFNPVTNTYSLEGILFTQAEATGQILADGASCEFTLPVVTRKDEACVGDTPGTQTIDIDVLSNDIKGTNDIDPTSVRLIDPVSNTYEMNVIVPTVGEFTVDTATGKIEFTALATFSGVYTIQYIVRDINGKLSLPADIVVRTCYCTKPGDFNVEGVPTKVGITVQKKQDAWPENIPNGWIALESKEKGMVITRVQNSNTIAEAKEGMLIYDIDAQCVKLYNGTTWKCLERSCNE